MSATVTDLVTEQSTTYQKVFTFTNSHGVDPADYTGAMDIKTSATAETATVAITTTANDNGSVITLSGTAASITITVDITDDDAALLTGKNYVYDILLTDTSGNVRRPFAGNINNILSATGS